MNGKSVNRLFPVFCLLYTVVVGEVPEWPKGTDCKSVGEAYGGSNPPLPTIKQFKQFIRFKPFLAGVAQLARASAFQAEGRGFESRLPLQMEDRN